MKAEKNVFVLGCYHDLIAVGCDAKQNAPVPHNRYHTLICVRFCATKQATLPENRVASEEHI